MASNARSFSRWISFLTLCGTSGTTNARKAAITKMKCCSQCVSVCVCVCERERERLRLIPLEKSYMYMQLCCNSFLYLKHNNESQSCSLNLPVLNATNRVGHHGGIIESILNKSTEPVVFKQQEHSNTHNN